jgi:hypothetical protein
MSIVATFNESLAQAKLAALQILLDLTRELADADASSSAAHRERRLLATAILRTRPMAEPRPTAAPTPPDTRRPTTREPDGINTTSPSSHGGAQKKAHLNTNDMKPTPHSSTPPFTPPRIAHHQSRRVPRRFTGERSSESKPCPRNLARVFLRVPLSPLNLCGLPLAFRSHRAPPRNRAPPSKRAPRSSREASLAHSVDVLGRG